MKYDKQKPGYTEDGNLQAESPCDFSGQSKLLKVDPESPEPDKIKLAAEMLAQGKLVIFPTETVYGLGANALDKKALNRLYKVKQRPANKPLTLHIADIDQFWSLLGRKTNEGEDLDIIVRKLWPGPLTVIVKDCNGLKTGVRMPASRIALDLIKEAGVPVVAPSANISGRPAPVSAQQAIEELGDQVDLILDGGPSRIGESSTVIDLTTCSYTILRQGSLSRTELIEAGLNMK